MNLGPESQNSKPYTLEGRETVISIAEQPAPALHLTRPKGRAALTHMRELLCSVLTATTSNRHDLIKSTNSQISDSH